VERERTEVAFDEEGVTDPVGIFPSPVIESVCSPTSEDKEDGRVAGTPGNTSVKDVTRPAVSHCMPLQEPQKSTFFDHPTFCKVWFAVALTMSLSAQNCKIVPWPVMSVFFAVGERSLGIVWRTAAHVPHGYEEGFDGAFSLNWDRQSLTACEGPDAPLLEFEPEFGEFEGIRL